MAEEQLIVFPRAVLDRLGSFHGFRPDNERYIAEALTASQRLLMPRPVAEQNPAFKQLIIYVLIRSASGMFSYRRSKRVGEQRLSGLRSIGIGGHMNEGDLSDGPADDLILATAVREIEEEVVGEGPIPVRVVGVLNDDKSEVGRVHFGIVAVADVGDIGVRLRDSTLVEGQWLSIEELLTSREEYETWSALCIDALGRGEIR